MNEIQQAQLQVLSLREELKSAEGRLAFLQGFAAGQKSQEDNARAEKEAAAERQEKLRAAKASLAAVKANRTRRKQKAETLKAETLKGAADSGDDLVAGAEKEFKRRAAKSVFGGDGAQPPAEA